MLENNEPSNRKSPFSARILKRLTKTNPDEYRIGTFLMFFSSGGETV